MDQHVEIQYSLSLTKKIWSSDQDYVDLSRQGHETVNKCMTRYIVTHSLMGDSDNVYQINIFFWFGRLEDSASVW